MFDYNTAVGLTGATLLLLAFFLTVIRKIGAHSKTYYAMNVAGSLISGYASILINYIPFVILEFIWLGVALTGLINAMRKK